MASRVTAEEVKAILNDTELTDDIIDTYISSANVFVNQVLVSTSLSSDVLKEIERWLTAHMIVISRERLTKEEGAGGAKVVYMGEVGKGLEATPYGQMVLELDTTGKMASLASKPAWIKAIRSFR